MDVIRDWDAIRAIVNRHATSCVIASADAEGTPHITPIGSFTLTGPGRGYYIEKFAATLPAHAAVNHRLCVLVMRMSLFGFMKGLARGRLDSWPGLRLHVLAGELRPITAAELNDFLPRVRIFRAFKGHRMLWGNLTQVREVKVVGADPLTIGPLTAGATLRD